MIMEKDQFFEVGMIDEITVGKMKDAEVSGGRKVRSLLQTWREKSE